MGQAGVGNRPSVQPGWWWWPHWAHASCTQPQPQPHAQHPHTTHEAQRNPPTRRLCETGERQRCGTYTHDVGGYRGGGTWSWCNVRAHHPCPHSNLCYPGGATHPNLWANTHTSHHTTQCGPSGCHGSVLIRSRLHSTHARTSPRCPSLVMGAGDNDTGTCTPENALATATAPAEVGASTLCARARKRSTKDEHGAAQLITTAATPPHTHAWQLRPHVSATYDVRGRRGHELPCVVDRRIAHGKGTEEQHRGGWQRCQELHGDTEHTEPTAAPTTVREATKGSNHQAHQLPRVLHWEGPA